MSVLIRGMGLPTYGATMVLVLQNGEVYGMKYGSDKWELLGQAIELPPHGDLIDRDATRGRIKSWSPEDERSACTFDTVKKLMHIMLTNAPAIIPAEECE